MIIIVVAGLTLLALLFKHAGVTWFGLQEVASTTLLLVGGFVLIASLLWRMQRDRQTTYDALDMVMDQGRASLDKHITGIMALLAIWWIVSQTLAGKDVSERMIDVLMIFVVYRGAKEFINAYSKRPVEQPGDQQIEQQVIVSPEAPAIPPPRELPKVKATKMAPSAGRTATGKPTHRES